MNLKKQPTLPLLTPKVPSQNYFQFLFSSECDWQKTSELKFDEVIHCEIEYERGTRCFSTIDTLVPIREHEQLADCDWFDIQSGAICQDNESSN